MLEQCSHLAVARQHCYSAYNIFCSRYRFYRWFKDKQDSWEFNNNGQVITTLYIVKYNLDIFTGFLKCRHICQNMSNTILPVWHDLALFNLQFCMYTARAKLACKYWYGCFYYGMGSFKTFTVRSEPNSPLYNCFPTKYYQRQKMTKRSVICHYLLLECPSFMTHRSSMHPHLRHYSAATHTPICSNRFQGVIDSSCLEDTATPRTPDTSALI